MKKILLIVLVLLIASLFVGKVFALKGNKDIVRMPIFSGGVAKNSTIISGYVIIAHSPSKKLIIHTGSNSPRNLSYIENY